MENSVHNFIFISHSLYPIPSTWGIYTSAFIINCSVPSQKKNFFNWAWNIYFINPFSHFHCRSVFKIYWSFTILQRFTNEMAAFTYVYLYIIFSLFYCHRTKINLHKSDKRVLPIVNVHECGKLKSLMTTPALIYFVW